MKEIIRTAGHLRDRLRPGLALLFVLSVVDVGFAQSDLHQQTTPPGDARFEIVQSQLTARWTFRLDRFTGEVAQLVRTWDDRNAWQLLEVERLPEIPRPSKPRFQLFMSGLVARHTFLIDTDTGRTWTSVTAMRSRPDGTEYEVVVWEPFAP